LQQLAATSSRRRVRARSKGIERDRSNFKERLTARHARLEAQAVADAAAAKVARDKPAPKPVPPPRPPSQSKASSKSLPKVPSWAENRPPRRRQGKDKRQRNPHRCRRKERDEEEARRSAAKGLARGSRVITEGRMSKIK